jgi:hypothetical protein
MPSPAATEQFRHHGRVLSAAAWIVLAMLVNGLVFRWLGGFGSAGRAVSRWGDLAGRRWVRRHGLHSLRR